MAFVLSLAFFALGAIFASFIGLVVARLYTNETILRGRSRCDACGAIINITGLIPVFSWVFLRGRAVCCGARVSIFSTITELVLGGLFVLAYFHFGISISLLLALVALVLITGIVLYDLAHFIIPPVFLAPFLIVTLFFAWSAFQERVLDIFLVALLIGVFLAAIHFLSRGRAMGLSDAPFAFSLALFAGTTALSGIFYSFLFGAVVGIGILVNAPRGHKMGIEVPFAPYLAAGFLFALFTQWDALELITALLSRITG